MKPFHLFDSPLRGSHLIEASAGTGKTTIITWLFLRLLVEERLAVNEILAVTFTEAATAELKDRVRSLLREAMENLSFPSPSSSPLLREYLKRWPAQETLVRLLQALRSFDEAAIFTIHGFCARTLRENAFESGAPFDAETAPNLEALVEEAVEDFWRLHFYHAPPELAAHALDKKYGPEYFKSFLGNLLERPDLPIPEIKYEPYCCEPYRDALQKIKEAWPGVRESIHALFQSSNLNRKKYKVADLPALLEKMDFLTQGRGAAPALFPGLEKFTAEYLAQSMNKKESPPDHPFFHLCQKLRREAAGLGEALDRHLLHLKHELFHHAKEEMERNKRRKNVRSFSDLLTHLRDPLRDPRRGPLLARSLREKYQAALIDEFQDTDPVQWEIFRTVFEAEGRSLFLIGDPKQAIYSFRGADVHAYLEASENTQARYTLKTNYRSEAGLVAAVNALFSRPIDHFVFRKIQYHPMTAAPDADKAPLAVDGKREPPLHLWFVDRRASSDPSKPLDKGAARERIAQAVAAEAARLLGLGQEGRARIGERPVDAGDIAVLTRTHREARRIQRALGTLRVPSVLESTGNLFDSHEAMETQRLLTAILHPADRGAVKAALSTDIMGWTGEALETLMEEEYAWGEVILHFQEDRQAWERHGFIRMFRQFMAREEVQKRLLDFPDGERRVTNMIHLAEILHQKTVERGLGMEGIHAWLAAQRDPDSPVREKEHELRLESDDTAVRIVTIHKSKGLEYPVVFCPFSWGGSDLNKKDAEGFIYHDEEGHLALALGPAEIATRTEARREEYLAENLRLFYVAVTRAKNRCYLVWGGLKDAETSAPAYLFHHKGAPESFFHEGAPRIGALSDEELLADLKSVAAASHGNIFLASLPEGPGRRLERVKVEDRSPVLQTFAGKVEESWRISSFSSLVFNKAALADLPDRDPLHAPPPPLEEEKGASIFSFPRGAKAGNFFHEIFEEVDFSGGDPSSLVEMKLKKYGYDPLEWGETITSTVKKVLQVPLCFGNERFSLSQIPPENRIHEMEFHFPISRLTSGELKNIFAEFGGPAWTGEFPERMGRLNFSPAGGFMKGFMDMVFQFGGRYCLLDWKSNHLGNRVEDYHPAALKAVMEEEFYLLQYHIYMVALHRYLAARMPRYDYRRHIGGVYYIFLRGVDPERGPEYGVFHDLPGAELVEGLSRAFRSHPLGVP